MFGYIRAAKPELKVKEFDAYKAVYCSLCRKLGKSYGFLSRFTLSYDFTFLAMLNMAFSDGCPVYEHKRCAFNPLKKCNYCKDGAEFDMPSAAAIIMLYYKILDNIEDSCGIKKAGFHLLKPIFAHAHKKAAKSYPEIETTVFNYIEKLKKLEAENCTDMDAAADPTANALSEILAFCSNDASQKRVLNRLGYCLGRYIYLLDAACDFEDDVKTKSYNVFKTAESMQLTENQKKHIVSQLYFCANESAKAFELLDIKKYKSILGNIIYLGLEETFIKELNIK